jgi:hypothetical protein
MIEFGIDRSFGRRAYDDQPLYCAALHITAVLDNHLHTETTLQPKRHTEQVDSHGFRPGGESTRDDQMLISRRVRG